jgi:TfoX/Sxy family transcriptional regulator of competence genes
MAYNIELADRVRESLAQVPNVEEKKMFRGVTFMVNDKMCVTVGDNEIMCRIDPELQPELIKKKGCNVMVMKGREYKGYILVDGNTIPMQQDLHYWISLALDFNKRAKSSKKTQK